jgi:hypothetical protein
MNIAVLQSIKHESHLVKIAKFYWLVELFDYGLRFDMLGLLRSLLSQVVIVTLLRNEMKVTSCYPTHM